ncbi:hypothetical protein Hypma_006571 [Hypsizygus marmoreus]|uniref:Uncharacterized protein n=1 Tax=Hypsizygus marmoreus TaxID=39966 RepID=A0A369JY39_HYPMA|nr:hypothetical protein Hypma_006571 [Hypsizygus marmoreus]
MTNRRYTYGSRSDVAVAMLNIRTGLWHAFFCRFILIDHLNLEETIKSLSENIEHRVRRKFAPGPHHPTYIILPSSWPLSSLKSWLRRYPFALKSAMQSDTVVDQTEEDEDSLFGSPPSTPARGRSPSPALALPSASYSTQNVGTIALPGSHHYSELPVNPLASSSSRAYNEPSPRPPAQSPSTLKYYRPHVLSTSSASSSSGAFAASTGRPKKTAPPPPKPLPKPPPPKKPKPTPRPPPPQIPLPDPSAPLPANFLRNQTALLGTAGLVAGIKPANLSHRHTRGTIASNPIVVEDEDDAPRLGRTSRFRQPYAQPVDPTLLPTPSTQDVVAMLIGQKDIFPVLESLLKLIANGSGHTSTSSFRSSSTRSISSQQFESQSTSSTSSDVRPPQKKRKLNRVPAGAVDWDVPYPFPQGEGPDSYRSTWERERGRQLISQLVTLIKTAAKKAATRLYVQHEAARKERRDEAAKKAIQEDQRAPHMQESAYRIFANETKVHGHYRPSTVTYGLVGEAAVSAEAQVLEVLTDASNGKGKAPVGPTPSPYLSMGSKNSTSGPQPSTPFDQLISSLLAATPNANLAKSSPSVLPGTVVMLNSDSNFNSGSSTPMSSGGSEDGMNVDQGLFDNWMNILQTFPMPSEGFAQTQASGIPEGSTSAVTTEEDFGFFDDVDPNFDFDMNTSASQSTLSATTMGAYIHDNLIDPALLAISAPSQTANVVSGHNLEHTPSLAVSPMSSIAGSGPTTPNSANWDLAYPDVVMTGELGRGLGGQGGDEGYLETVMQQQGQGEGGDAQKQDKGKGREVETSLPKSIIPLSTTWTSTASAPYQVFSYPGLVTSTSTLQTVPQPTVEKTLNKEDILRRAAERKKLLQEELNRVKTQLWETTIEQGVLAHLSKQYNQAA